MNIFIRAWRSFLYRTRGVRLKHRVCGLGKKMNKRALLVCVPDHSNIGDMAIAVAEKVFLKSCGISFVSMTSEECDRNLPMLKKAVKSDTLICYHGGGNLGNVYGFEESVRRKLLTEFPQNPSVIFPQTIFFTPDEEGRADMEAASSVYGGHKKLTVALRDKSSYETAKKMFPSANVIFSPDIVMSTEKSTFGVKEGNRNGVLLCFRGDCERSMTQSEKDKLASALEERGMGYGYTDMMAESDLVPQREQMRCVSDKMKELSGAGLVITDRLHGMVFSAITETPCIAFGNYNHKVEQSYKMLEHLGYIKFVKDVDEAIALVDEMYGGVGSYDRAPILPLYRELKNTLLEYTRKQ